jgi:hypothetical protein
LQSVEVLQFVKHDLDEFSTAVKSEASNVVSSTTSALKDKLRVSCACCIFHMKHAQELMEIASFSSSLSLCSLIAL